MLLRTYKNGWTLRRPKSGGKAGTGLNKTSNYQVWDQNNCVVKQFRFIVDHPTDASRAKKKAVAFCEKAEAKSAGNWP
jgi:hypothetical protein